MACQNDGVMSKQMKIRRNDDGFFTQTRCSQV